MKVSVLIALSALLFSSATMANAEDSAFRVIKKVHLGGEGGWDYLTVDSAHRRLYVARMNRVMVVDIDKNTLIKVIIPAGDPTTDIHGVAVVPDLNRGFFTCGRDNTVRTFDLTTLTENGSINVGERPDGILYDSSSKQIFCFNHKGATASVIDPSTYAVKATIELGGEPESGVTDNNGHVFVNLEDKSEVAVIDTSKLAVTAHWPLAPGTKPTGLAIDSEHHRIFSGCKNQNMVIMDTDSGKVVATAPIGGKVDACAFDPKTQTAFSSNGTGTMSIIHEDDPNTFHLVDNVETQVGARTMALDPKTHRLYLASAEVKDTPNHHKKMITPDSFSLLIVGQ